MTTTQTEIESQIIELLRKAFIVFCDDISQMFGVDMSCKPLEPCAETIKGLEKKFKKLVAVIDVKSVGALEGNFQFIFDKMGLFILSGVIIMLPEQRILNNSKYGSAEDAKMMSDTMGEAGNLLVGSWNRLFREELESHGHFSQSNTFIGNPLGMPIDKTGLAKGEKLLFVPCEMKIGSYPPFNCSVIFPRTIFSETFVSDAETATATDEESQENIQEKVQDQQIAAEKTKAEAEEKAEAEAEKKEPAEAEGSTEAQTEEKAKAEAKIETEEKAKVEAEEKTEAEAEKKEPAEAEGSTEAETEEKISVEAEEKTTTVDESKESPSSSVSETIEKMVQSPADLPGECNSIFSVLSAKDIMQKGVIWGSANESVQQALTKMQQADVGYMMVGTEGQLDGIVSKSDITGAVSVYLRPTFAKWRRPIDDNTLQIKIKWIMTSPVHTIMPETSLVQIMDNICRLGRRALPVVDQQGKVQGLVTVFDIYQALLSGSPNISYVGKTHQAPPLGQLDLPAGKEAQDAKQR